MAADVAAAAEAIKEGEEEGTAVSTQGDGVKADLYFCVGTTVYLRRALCIDVDPYAVA